MRCPACEWISVSYSVDTGQWSCTRCGHAWSRSASSRGRSGSVAPPRASRGKPKRKGAARRPSSTTRKRVAGKKGRKKTSRRR